MNTRITGRQFRSNLRSVSADTTLTIQDDHVLVDASGGNVSITLPSAIGNSGNAVVISKRDATTNLVTITPVLGQLINGAGTQVIQYQFTLVYVVSDGSNWFLE